MAETYVEFVNRLLRDHEGYTGDGKGSVGDLPVGDRRTAVRPIIKRDLRNAILAGELAVNRAIDAAADAESAAALAQTAMVDTQGATLFAANLATLLASTATSRPLGTVFATRAEGYAYEVVSSGQHLTTAGGVRLRAQWRGDARDLPAAGIDTTGGVDAAPLLTAYLAARAGLVAIVPPGRYRLDTTVNIPSDTNLDLRNCVFDLATLGTGTPAFKAAGTQGADIIMSARPVAGQSNIFLTSTAGLTAGDVIRVTSDAAFDPARTNSKIGELARIREVFADRIVLHAPLMDDYTSGANGRVAKITPVRRVNIVGPARFDGKDRANAKAIWIEKAVDCRISGIDFVHFDDRALWLQDCENVNGDDLNFQDFDAPSTGYGISCIDATQHCRFTNIHGRRVRHLFATNNTTASNGIPRHITVDGFSVDSSALAEGGTGGDAMDTHAASEHINFLNGVIRGATSCGINMEGAGGTISNVKVFGAVAHGIYASNFSRRQGFISITDCETHDTGQSGIRVTAGGAQPWGAVRIDARVVRAGTFPVSLSGDEAKLCCDIDVSIVDCAGTHMLYLKNGRDGHVRVRTKGQTEPSAVVHLVRLLDCIGLTADVQGRMSNGNAGSRGLWIDKSAEGVSRNIAATVNLRNEVSAGTGVSVTAGGTNIVVAASPRVIDNFATAISGTT